MEDVTRIRECGLTACQDTLHFIRKTPAPLSLQSLTAKAIVEYDGWCRETSKLLNVVLSEFETIHSKESRELSVSHTRLLIMLLQANQATKIELSAWTNTSNAWRVLHLALKYCLNLVEVSWDNTDEHILDSIIYANTQVHAKIFSLSAIKVKNFIVDMQAVPSVNWDNLMHFKENAIRLSDLSHEFSLQWHQLDESNLETPHIQVRKEDPDRQYPVQSRDPDMEARHFLAMKEYFKRNKRMKLKLKLWLLSVKGIELLYISMAPHLLGTAIETLQETPACCKRLRRLILQSLLIDHIEEVALDLAALVILRAPQLKDVTVIYCRELDNAVPADSYRWVEELAEAAGVKFNLQAIKSYENFRPFDELGRDDRELLE